MAENMIKSIDTATTASEELVPGLQPDQIPIGTPLAWPVVGADGMPLFERGEVLARAEDRDFLFEHFQPRRGDPLAQDRTADSDDAIDPQTPPTVADLDLFIGMRLGIGPQRGKERAMHPSRLIGVAPNQLLFVMPPLIDGRPLALESGEQVEVLADSSRAVFLFVCTVETVCRSPFQYLVLSEPGAIRRLRVRRSVRVPARLAVRYATSATDTGYEGLGMSRDVSPLGLSLAVPTTLGQPGERLRVAFRFRTNETELGIESDVVLRSVQNGEAPDGLIAHGVEFERLEPAQRIALKCFVLEHSPR